MTQLMNAGSSWSGRERNCGFLNLHDGTFADASAALGLDFRDDGRAVSVTDWDGDGDLDLWLKNRSGPQLRFLRNNSDRSRHYVAFKLEGTACNRDAVGARIELLAAGQRYVRTVNAGDGYLSQSSKWLHFGIGEADSIDGLTVHWPGAEPQTLSPPAVDTRYRIKQGRPPIPQPGRSVRLAETRVPIPKPMGTARVVLRVPLPLPPSITAVMDAPPSRSASAKLITLWAQWCAPCVTELAAFAADRPRLQSGNVSVIALSLDSTENHSKARALFRRRIQPEDSGNVLSLALADENTKAAMAAVLHHVLEKPGDISLPTSLLIDPAGQLQIVYLGTVTPDQLATDAAAYCHRRPRANSRAAFPGRWYYGMRRNYESLARELFAHDLQADTGFYVRLHRRQSGRRSGD